MSRHQRLLSVKELINENKNREESFEMIYVRLLEELEIEIELNYLLSQNPYLINLFITKEKADNFLVEKSIKKNPAEVSTKYFHFVDTFSNALNTALSTEIISR